MLNPAQPLSFEDVYAKYAEAALRRIHRYIKDDAVARDLRQDIFLKMWRNWSTFDCHRGSLFSWIMVIATTTCIDYHRSISANRPQPEQLHDIGEASRPLGPDGFVARREVLRLTGQLPSGQREVLTMIYLKGLTQEEVSLLLNVPLGTIKTRKRSAILALRKIYR